MFIWDFVAETVLGQIIDWIYGQIVGFLGDFFMQMGNMGADLFAMSWVQSIVLFFLIWRGRSMCTGLVVAVFRMWN
ncbi:MAG: conjugal transfer protein TrbL family protein [Enterocloster clostridioformis]